MPQILAPIRLSTFTSVFALALATLLASARADESLKDIACRSVHLGYPGPEGSLFYNELTVDQSAPGSYFMACGFDAGYFGIQQLDGKRKVAIFSVWDPGDQNDPNKVADDQRVKLVHQGEGVRIGRFGNEGTGGQSFLDVDWKLGEKYRFAVTARVVGDRTEYAGYIHLPDEQKLRHMVTFSTLAKGRRLRGYYSFIEDFRRNKISATEPRRAHFGNGWIQTVDDKWQPLVMARFTGDSNPATNINATLDGQQFTLATGGDTKNDGIKLNDKMQIAAPPAEPPADVRELANSPETPK